MLWLTKLVSPRVSGKTTTPQIMERRERPPRRKNDAKTPRLVTRPGRHFVKTKFSRGTKHIVTENSLDLKLGGIFLDPIYHFFI